MTLLLLFQRRRIDLGHRTWNFLFLVGSKKNFGLGTDRVDTPEKDGTFLSSASGSGAKRRLDPVHVKRD